MKAPVALRVMPGAAAVPF